MTSCIDETALMSLIIMLYVLISVVYITILLIQEIYELIISMKSCLKTIIDLIYKALSNNTFATVTHASISKDLNSISQKFFNLYWFFIEDGRTTVSILSPIYLSLME